MLTTTPEPPNPPEPEPIHPAPGPGVPRPPKPPPPPGEPTPPKPQSAMPDDGPLELELEQLSGPTESSTDEALKAKDRLGDDFEQEGSPDN